MTSSIVWELFILCHRVLKGTSTVWGSDFQNFHCPSKNPLLLEKNPPLGMTMQGWLCPSPYKCWSSSACVSCSWVEQVHSKDSTWLKQTIERVWLSHLFDLFNENFYLYSHQTSHGLYCFYFVLLCTLTRMFAYLCILIKTVITTQYDITSVFFS